MFRDQCKVCGGVGIVKNDKGNNVECRCVVKDRIYYYLYPFLPFENKGFYHVQDINKELVRKKKDSFLPVKVVFRSNKANHEKTLSRYRNLLIMYLLDTNQYDDYIILNISDILDLYLSNRLDDDTFNFYNIKYSVIIVVMGTTGIHNKEEQNIISTFIETHKNKDLFFVVKKKQVTIDKWEFDEKTRSNVKVNRVHTKDYNYYKNIFKQYNFSTYAL